MSQDTDIIKRLQTLEDKEFSCEMTSILADAATHVASKGFISLWAPDAVWQIGTAVRKEFKGHGEIHDAFLGLLCNA